MVSIIDQFKYYELASSLCILRIRLGLGQLLQVHAVQHGWTAGKKLEAGKPKLFLPGVTADVNHKMPVVLVRIYSVKIEEWRGLVFDWMSLSCLPEVCCSTMAFNNNNKILGIFFDKRLSGTL